MWSRKWIGGSPLRNISPGFPIFHILSLFLNPCPSCYRELGVRQLFCHFFFKIKKKLFFYYSSQSILFCISFGCTAYWLDSHMQCVLHNISSPHLAPCIVITILTLFSMLYFIYIPVFCHFYLLISLPIWQCEVPEIFISTYEKPM